MNKLLSFAFWFDQTPVTMSPAFLYGFLVFFALVAIAAALLRIASKRSLRDHYDRQAFLMTGNMLAFLSAFGFLWLFTTIQEVQLFGMRAWFLLWVAVLVGFAVYLYRYMTIDVPKERARNQSRADVNKYLPRRAR